MANDLRGALMRVATCGAAALALSASMAMAQDAGEKALVEQWLDGDLEYVGPEITYDGAPIDVRVAHFLAPNTPITTVLERAIARLHEESGGKFNVRVFYNNSLHDAQRGGFEGVAGGISDMSTCYSWINPGGFDLQLGLQLPFIFDRSTVGSHTIMQLYDEYFRDEYEAQGVLFARSTITQAQQLLTRGDPILSLEDLSGKRTMASGDLATNIVSALGGVPVPLTVAEYYSGFQQGVVDVMVVHDAGLKLFRFSELAKSRTVANLFSNPIEYCMNADFHAGLPEDMRALWDLWLGRLNHAEAQLYFDEVSAQGRAEAEAAGVVSHDLTDEERARWFAAVEPVVEAWLASKEAEGMPARQMLEDIRAKVAELDAMTDDELFQLIWEKPYDGLYQ